MVQRTQVDAAALEGKTVYSFDAVPVGEVAAVFFDRDTGKPEWLALRGTRLGEKQVLVPVADAEVREDGVGVPFSVSQIAGAPPTEGNEVSEEVERLLAAHYSVRYSAEERSDSGRRESRSDRPRARAIGLDSQHQRPERAEGGRQRQDLGRGRRSGEPTRAELYAEAQRLGLEGRSKMKKNELARALEQHRKAPQGDAGLASPFEVQAFLDGVGYPARQQDLVREAVRHGAPADVRSTLERIPDEEYESPTDVSKAIGRLS